MLRGQERCGTRGQKRQLGSKRPWVYSPSAALLKEITSNSSRSSPFFHFDTRIKDDLWSMPLEMVKNEAHLAAGESYLYLKEYIFTVLICSPFDRFQVLCIQK